MNKEIKEKMMYIYSAGIKTRKNIAVDESIATWQTVFMFALFDEIQISYIHLPKLEVLAAISHPKRNWDNWNIVVSYNLHYY